MAYQTPQSNGASPYPAQQPHELQPQHQPPMDGSYPQSPPPGIDNPNYISPNPTGHPQQQLAGHYANEKPAEVQHQQSYGNNPQQQYQQGTPQPSQQGVTQTPAKTPNNYQIATPLASLQQGPAAVDCPVCGVRELTRTEFVSGGTTQYVFQYLERIFFLSSLSQKLILFLSSQQSVCGALLPVSMSWLCSLPRVLVQGLRT